MKKVPWKTLVPSLVIEYNDKLTEGWRKLKGGPARHGTGREDFNSWDEYFDWYKTWSELQLVVVEKELLAAGFETRPTGIPWSFHINVAKWLADNS